MHEVLEEFMKDELDRREKQGIAIGLAEGEARGEIKGRAEATEEVTIANIRNIMKNLKITAEQAMEALGIAKKDYKKYMTML